MANAGTATQSAVIANTYDVNGNLLTKAEYDWAPYSNVLYGSSGVTPGTLLRTTTNTFVTSAAQGSNTAASDTTVGYWNPGGPVLPRLTLRSAVTGNGKGADSEYQYDSHGNVTYVFHWDSTKATSMPSTSGATYNLNSGNAVGTNNVFDGYGNLTQVTDPDSHVTKYTYDSNSLYITQKVDGFGSSVPRTTTYVNDQATGLHTSVTDLDNAVTSSYYYDALGRPTVVSGAGLAETQTQYEDSNLRVITRQDLNSYGDGQLVSVTEYDQLGRVCLNRQLETANSTQSDWDNDTEGIKTQTQYRYGTGASYKLVSNPYRATSDATMGWMLTTSDPDGRVTGTQYFTGAAQPAPWGSNNVTTGSSAATYSVNSSISAGVIGEVTSLTDEASKIRRTTVNGLGQLRQVVEDPSGLNYTTTYSYDVANNLTGVNQSGQPRTFTYDSLKRLGSATNPESGTTQYTYDNNGNLMTKTDARNVQTTYGSYDALNRPTSKSFSDGTPTVNYCYDGNVLSGSQCVASSVPYSKGSLTWIGNSVSSTSYSAYDALGRVTGSTQTTGGTPYPFSYTYNSSSLTSETYPSGRTIAFTSDAAGRVSAVSGKLGTVTTPYAGSSNSPITYWPQGAMNSMPLGNGLTETTTFNNRLQPTGIQAGGLSLQYAYSATANNGNPVSQTIVWQGTTNQDNYLYDGTNRLSQAAESATVPTQTGCTNGSASWCETYGYDAFGNRTITARTNLTQSTVEATSYDTTTNRNLPTVGWSYDSAGNSLSDPLSGSYAYDAENRQKTATVTGSGTTQYSYDGEGRRVVSNGLYGQTVFVYDAHGELAAEYGVVGGPSTGTEYLTADHLGSTRMVTDSQGNCLERHDYLAFGVEENRGSGSCYDYNAGVRQKFTGKERDAETGLDYFGAQVLLWRTGEVHESGPTARGPEYRRPAKLEPLQLRPQ